jgi:alanyl-tRNA synthetase/REP element-mobilizing transposase RayT
LHKKIFNKNFSSPRQKLALARAKPFYYTSFRFQMMTSTQIRKSFLDFFKSKKHTIVPSSSLMPDSPNLLFTNAGMNQFVPIFLGQTQCPYTPGRAADTQKCIRAGGKHNDLEDVGLDTYHHTFFEMLGNWSFGDYFKKEAIEWAWELVVVTWKFPPARIYATVFCPYLGQAGWEEKWKADFDLAQGRLSQKPAPATEAAATYDESAADIDAIRFWMKQFQAARLDPRAHIIPGSKKDNFWMMGETGPCGPCSELHVDLTPNGDTKGALVNKGSPQCIEIWNLVFIQFNANPDGTFSPLPARHVDTGMGFERVASIIQGTQQFTDFANARISNYETDIFRPIFDALEKLSGKKYGSTVPAAGGQLNVQSETRADGGAHAPSRAPDRALAVGTDARHRALSSGSAATAGTTETKYSRRNLPHFERPWAKYMVTFSTRERRKLTPPERDMVLKSILYADEHRQYQIYAACVMPDHVHLLFEPQIKEQDRDGKPVFWSLSEILQGIKSASAHNINKTSGATGHVWEQESLDRMIRGQSDLEEKFHYICRNPWEAGVVQMTENYPWVWTPEPRAEARVGAVDEASTAAREARALPAPSAEQFQIDIAFRVIADHIRTLSFAIADGIQPGNNDRNYVLRRILRRAVRYGRTLGFKEPFFYKLVDVLADTMGDVFPEIRARKQQVQETIQREEEAFNKTLDRGIKHFNGYLAAHIHASLTQDSSTPEALRSYFKFIENLDTDNLGSVVQRANAWDSSWNISRLGPIQADVVFDLYDTYGFPLDLTELMARERGLTVDKAGFEKLMEEQRARARAAQKKEVVSLSQIETTTPTQFVGFENLAVQAKVLEVVSLKNKTAIILDTSACYAEMGGQVGDTGELNCDGNLWRVTNTQKSGNTWLHFIESSAENSRGEHAPSRVPDRALAVGTDARHRALEPRAVAREGAVDEASTAAPEAGALPIPGNVVMLYVDQPRRNSIQRHHTVTHLLHWALHEVVSKEASQKGSFVGPDKLTFDFNSAPLTPQQVADVEKLVNERIVENAGVSWTEVPYADVKSRKDVMQFFGDKYGETVRVVQIGGRAQALDGYSMELCGGTHTRATGEIGLFRIVGENAIAAGVRRIEAVAGLEAYRKATDEVALIKTIAGKVNSPVHELDKKIEALLTHQKELEKQLKVAQQREASNAASLLLEEVKVINGVQVIIHNLGAADGDFLQAIADSLKGRFKGVLVLGGAAGGAVSLLAAVSPDFQHDFQAGKIIQQIAPIVGGKGGGKPDNARGGGKDATKLEEALAKAKSLFG